MRDKLVDEMAEEMTIAIMDRNKDVSEIYTKQEVFIFCKCFVEKISELVSEWVENFVKEQGFFEKKETINEKIRDKH